MRIVAFGKREEIPPSSHLCQIYSRPDEVPQIAAAVLGGELPLSRELSVFIGPPAAAVQVEALLSQQIKGLADFKDAGQLVLTTDRVPYLSHGRFDPYYLLASHLTLINQARTQQLEAVRLVIEMSWLSEGLASPAQILKYEAMCDSVFTFQQKPIVVVAQYSASRIGDQIAGEMMKLHPLAIVGKYLRRNPSYLNSEQYFFNILKLTRKHTPED